MDKNMNPIDRLARFFAGLLFMWLMFLADDDLLLSMVFGLLGIYFLITAIIGICPFYLLMGLNSFKSKDKMR